jgi:transposase
MSRIGIGQSRARQADRCHVQNRITAQPDLTIDEVTAELAAEHGVKVHRPPVGRLLLRLGLSRKKRPASA